jgi:hypothetical protein
VPWLVGGVDTVEFTDASAVVFGRVGVEDLTRGGVGMPVFSTAHHGINVIPETCSGIALAALHASSSNISLPMTENAWMTRPRGSSMNSCGAPFQSADHPLWEEIC